MGFSAGEVERAHDNVNSAGGGGILTRLNGTALFLQVAACHNNSFDWRTTAIGRKRGVKIERKKNQKENTPPLVEPIAALDTVGHRFNFNAC